MSSSRRPRLPWGSLIGQIARRPDLWATAIGVVRRFTPPGWWRRRPFLPVPAPSYLKFRLQTQYGDTELGQHGDDRVGADVIAYLEWCRSWRRYG